MIKIISSVIFISILCFAQPVIQPALDFNPQKYICYRAAEPLNVDGNLNESVWAKAEWTIDFADIEGDVKPVPRFRTRAKMLWDDNYFYIAAELQEPDIWGNLKNRDDIIFYDNDFEVFIDPDGNTHSYFEYEMNVLNTVWDLLLIQPYRDMDKAPLHGFDLKGLKSGVKVYGSLNKPGDIDSCWTVEIAFPWKSFEEITIGNCPPKDTDQWRVNFSRVEWKTEVKDGKYQKVINPETGKPFPEDNWVWSPQGIVNMHYPEMWGFVQFSDKPAGSQKVSFVQKPEEAAKCYLRRLYYNQKKFLYQNGTYTSDLSKLNITDKAVEGFTLPPVLESTSGMFEASLTSSDGKYKVTINNHGLTSIVPVKN
jgi:hypothetical protein